VSVQKQNNTVDCFVLLISRRSRVRRQQWRRLSVRISVSQSVIYTSGRQRKAAPTGGHRVRETPRGHPRGHLHSACVVINPSVTSQPTRTVSISLKWLAAQHIHASYPVAAFMFTLNATYNCLLYIN